MDNDFKFVVPAEITKSKDGEWRVTGLASTSSVDRQGEIILPEGIDATPIAKGRGMLNFDHDNSPENTIGALDGYKKTPNGMYVEGRLFKNHTRAKAVYEIMSSLNKGDRGRVGMSVEGKVLERDPKNPSIIKRCLIKNVAITLNPVNQDTYADIVKSMTSNAAQIDFESTGEANTVLAYDGVSQVVKSEEPTFTVTQVMSMIEKALGISAGYAQAPQDLKGGDALAMQDFDKNKRKKLKKAPKAMYKSQMLNILEQLQVLYPDVSRSELWNAVQDRLETKFPELK